MPSFIIVLPNKGSTSYKKALYVLLFVKQLVKELYYYFK